MKRVTSSSEMRNAMPKNHVKGLSSSDKLSRSYLRMHSIAQEKNRLEKELAMIEQKRYTIMTRLDVLLAELQQIAGDNLAEENAQPVKSLHDLDQKSRTGASSMKKPVRGNVLKY